MREFREVFGWLVEADVSVMTKTKKLQIGSATAFYDGFEVVACFLCIRFGAIRDMSVCRIDIYVRKQVIIHKIIITLVVVMCQSTVFIQIDGSNLRKIKVPFFIPVYQCFISTYR